MKATFMAVALMGMLLGANAGAVDLTAKNFDKEVLESGKSAFVKFLAPWCVRRLPCAFSIVFLRRSARIPRFCARSQPPRAATRLGTLGLTPASSSAGLRNITAPPIEHPAASGERTFRCVPSLENTDSRGDGNFLFRPNRQPPSRSPRLPPLSSRQQQVRPLQVDEARLG